MNISIALGGANILAILSLPIHEHRISFYLLPKIHEGPLFVPEDIGSGFNLINPGLL